MPNWNRITMIGHITRDPQLSYTPSNTAVCEFGIAENERYTDKSGNKKEDVCFVDCVAYGRTAELIAQYFAKGKPILVEGRLKFEQWEKDGQKRSKHKILVNAFTFVGGDGRNESTGNAAASPAPQDDSLPAVPEVPF